MPEIWKFLLPTHGRATLPIPIGARLLTVQAQRSDIVLWAAVDRDNRKSEWVFDVRMTGEPWPGETGDYVGTVQVAEGAFVAHVFSLGNGPTSGQR